MSTQAVTPPRGNLASRGAAGAALVAVTAGILFAWLQPSHGKPIPVIDAAFCALAPQAAHADPADKPDVQLAATVPLATPEPGAMATNSIGASQGNVVRVAVTSPRDGGVAVHGLLDVHPIGKGEQVTVEFRAIYSGRFPVHFHGADGSHFEIAAIEVMPLKR